MVSRASARAIPSAPVVAVLALALAAGSPRAAEPVGAPDEQRHRHGAGGGRDGRGHDHHGTAHGNPADLGAYARTLLDPARDAWQKPDAVVAALGLRPGDVACDVGAGPGYFTLRLARAVGSRGHVYAVDVEPALLAALRDQLDAARIANVTPVLSLAADPLLPRAACDVVLVVNTYHHFPDGPAYLRRLASSLRQGGRIVNVDFEKRPTPMGPPVARRVSREDFVADAAKAGLAVVGEPRLLDFQYVVVLRPGK
jgi:SAM-dependent methyltransferase